MLTKKRAMTSEKASLVKRRGHQDAQEFALALEIGKEFKSDPIAKKDVIDEYGFSYSVKSGDKKWQIFLYGKSRFEKDFTFKSMNGLGELFLKCINAFPLKREDYLKNKIKYKQKLQGPMRKLAQKLSQKNLLEGFIDKAMFNSGEVDFLVIKSDDKFFVFSGREVVETLALNIVVENSKARSKNQLDDQKVIFKVEGKTIGEIEIRNDSEIHYREVKFWLDKKITFNLLKSRIKESKEMNKKIIVYGKAIKQLRKYFQ